MSTRSGAVRGEDPLATLPSHLQELFAARLERWSPDLDAALARLEGDPAAVRDRLLDLAARAYAARPDALHALDLHRTLAPDWFQRPDVIGYAAYADRLAPTLAAVAERASYLEGLGVRYLHLLGPDLTAREDLRALTARLREGGISLCVDHALDDCADPDRLCEHAATVLDLADDGVEIFRLGLDGAGESAVHAVVQALRTLTRIACPATLFEAAVDVAPQDLPAYLGRGEHWGKVSDLARHDGLMVHLWSMLASRDVRLASAALRALPTPPSTTAWITYARCHDDIAWLIDDETAAAVGATGQGHRSFLSDFYAGDFPGSWARGLAVHDDLGTAEPAISGSLATLAGLEADDPSATDRIRLAHALVLGFGGVPMIWMGDEVGLLDDADAEQEPVQRVESDLRRLIAARKALPHLHASVPADVLQPRDPGVLLVARRHPVGAMLGVYNVTDTRGEVPREVLYSLGLDPRTAVDRITGRPVRSTGDAVEVAPYDAMWLTAP